MPEQALGGIPLGFGIVVEDKPSELSCDSLVWRYIVMYAHAFDYLV